VGPGCQRDKKKRKSKQRLWAAAGEALAGCWAARPKGKRGRFVFSFSFSNSFQNNFSKFKEMQRKNRTITELFLLISPTRIYSFTFSYH
jgi:hypothetical protein